MRALQAMDGVENMNALAVVGLVYDIFGVCIIAAALIGPRRYDLYHQAGTYYVGNKALFKALLLQRTDAWFGLPILVGGFVLQLLGAMGLDAPRKALWLLFALLPVALITYGGVRRWNSRRADGLFDEMHAEEKAASEE